jgi:hypothetical protein
MILALKLKDYTYYPQDKCLKPYIVQIDFRPSNNMAGIDTHKKIISK